MNNKITSTQDKISTTEDKKKQEKKQYKNLKPIGFWPHPKLPIFLKRTIDNLLIHLDFEGCNAEDSRKIWPIWDDPSGRGVSEWYERMWPV